MSSDDTVTDEEEAAVEDTLDSDVERRVKQSRVHEQNLKKRKTLTRYGIFAGIALLIGLGVYALFVPYKGGMAFGICRVFLERYVTYPDTLKLNSYEEFSDSIRIWHMHIDAFGEHRMEPVQCWFRPDETTGLLALDKVTIKRRPIEQAYIDQFNESIPVIYAHPPDLTLPYPLSDDLENLHFEVNTYMRPIF